MAIRMKRSSSTQERFEKGKTAAKARVVERGVVAFRADPEMMNMLLRVAEHKRLPYGVMARSWVMDRLHKEIEQIKS